MTLTAMLITGCHHKPTMREMGIVLDTLITTSQAPLFDSLPSSPQCEVSIQLITLANDDLSSINDSLLRSGILSPEYLSLTTIHLTPKTAIDSFIKRYVDDYRSFYSGIYTDESDREALTMSYALATHIEEGRDSVLNYLGTITQRQGAVTTSYTVCRNIDVPSQRLLSLDDIFVHGHEKALGEAILNQLMKQSGNKTLDQLHEAGFFVNVEPYPTSNFILGDKTITFVYVTGEIASREKGEIQVELRYSDLKNIMRR